MNFFILVLASWRIANLLTDPLEVGPFEVLAKLRSKLGVKFDEYSIPYGTNEIGKIFSCIWCMSVWVGAVITFLYLLFPYWVMLIVGLPFGLSAGIVIIHRFVRA